MQIESTKLRKTWSLLSLIFLGALGSAFWDILLKHVVYNLGEIFFRLMISVHSNYVDTLYDKVGTQSEIFLYIPSLVIVFSIIFSPFVVYSLLSKNEKITCDILALFVDG